MDPKHEEPPHSLPIIIITRGTTGKSIIAGSLCFLFYPRVTTKHRTRTDIQKKVIPQVLTVIYMLIPGWFCHTRKKERFKETGHFQDLWLCCLFNQWKLSFFNWYHIYGHMIVDKFSYYLGFNLDKNYNSVVFILIRNEWLFFVFLYVKLRILVKNGWDFWKKKKFKLS